MRLTSILLFSAAIILNFSCSTKQIAFSYFDSAEGEFIIGAEDGWTILGNASWGMENGILTGSSGEGYVLLGRELDDFELTVDVFPEKEMNSGIFIRCPGEEVSATGCYEINIWDDHVNPDFRTGSIVTHSKPKTDVSTVGKWNTYVIKAKGNKITAWVNGQKTASIKDDKTTRGRIALQANGTGSVKFRNLIVQVK